MNSAAEQRLRQWQHRCAIAVISIAAATTASALAAVPRADSGAANAQAGIVGSRELAFEPNRGQSAEPVRYIGRGRGYLVYLTATEVVLAPHRRHNSAMHMELVGANPSPTIAAQDVLPGEVNYVRGDKPTPRFSGIPTYNKVRYADVYPGIDVVYYGNGGNLEYDFIVRPGADVTAISVNFKGAERLAIDADGALRMQVAAGEIRQLAPDVYQETGRGRQRVAARWVRKGSNRFGISVASYDRSKPLVIDPLVVYSSYLGGNGDDAATGVAVDRQGNIYVAGATASPDFPGTPQRAAAVAAFVSKLDPNGRLLWSTYLLDTDEAGATGLAVDNAGNAYVTGTTSLWRETAWFDVFVAKLDVNGGVSAPSGYFFTFGSESSVDWGHRIAVDGAGNAYVAGTTSGPTFPATPGAVQATPAGDADGFVAKINATGTALVYATLLGGSGLDSANGIAVDQAGYAYITGSTESSDFPVTANGYRREHRGCYGETLERAASRKASRKQSPSTLPATPMSPARQPRTTFRPHLG
jgi:hypothetical protein